jgi:hypothetical protein
MALLNLSNLGVTTGLGLASGRSPSGQPLGGNVVSKVAQIGTEIFPQITKSAMSLAQAKQAQEQAQKQQALTIGSSLYSAAKPEFKEVDGRLIKIYPDGTTEVVQDLPKREIKEEDYQYTDDEGNKQIINLNLNDPDDVATFKSLKKQYPTTFRGLRADSKEALSTRKFNILGNDDLRERFRLGKATPSEVLEIQTILREERTSRPIFNDLGEQVGIETRKAPMAWEIAEQEAKQYYPNLYGSVKTTEDISTTEQAVEPKQETPTKETMKEPHLIENVDGSFVDANKEVNVLNRVFKNTEDIDFTLATGYGDIFTRGIDALKMGASEIPGLEGLELSKRKDAVNYIKTLFKTAKLAVRDEIGGKAFASDVADLRDEYPEDLGLFANFTDRGFLGRLQRHVGRMEMALEIINKEILANPMSYKTSTVARARERKIIFEQLLKLYAPVIEDYENKGTSQQEKTIGDPKKYDMRK